MTLYEGMFLLDPAEATHDWDGLKQLVTDMITRCGGEILYTERWPDRKLAYEIKGRRKGTYLLTYFKADGKAISPLRRESELSERVLRLLILKNDQALEEIERRKEAQQRGAVLAPVEAAPVGAPVGVFDRDEAGEEFAAVEAVGRVVEESAAAKVPAAPEVAEEAAVEDDEGEPNEGESPSAK